MHNLYFLQLQDTARAKDTLEKPAVLHFAERQPASILHHKSWNKERQINSIINMCHKWKLPLYNKSQWINVRNVVFYIFIKTWKSKLDKCIVKWNVMKFCGIYIYHNSKETQRNDHCKCKLHLKILLCNNSRQSLMNGVKNFIITTHTSSTIFTCVKSKALQSPVYMP